mgnify:CR=1 FL=1
MKILITGAAGFVGGVLTRYCHQAGHEVVGIGLNQPADLCPGTSFEICDVRDAAKLDELLGRFRPERVFHLAAQSYPTVSLEQPVATMDANANGTINLFEGLRKAQIRPTVVVACSSAEYGPVAAENLPVREDHPLRPLHPYGVSKVAQDLLAYQYFVNYGLPAIRIRIFNTTGAGKIGDVCSDLSRRVVEIERGERASLTVGNLTARRAILDVQDLVRALDLASIHGTPGEVYNVSAYRIYSVQELVDALRQKSGVDFTVQQDPALMRPSDEPVIAGNTEKFQAATGWRQEVDLMNTIEEMLAWWRRHLARPS